MPSFHIKTNYFVIPSMADEFIFPITGLSLLSPLRLGFVTFYNSSAADFLENPNMQKFIPLFKKHLINCRTVAHVDTRSANEEWKNACEDNSSVALMLLKQSIGLIYSMYYELKGYNDQCRIIISANGVHETEEGMEYFLCDSSCRGNDMTSSLQLTVNAEMHQILHKHIYLFLDLYAMNSEMDRKKLKLFESLYYILNEVHSIERISKIGAYFNLIFRGLKDIDFPTVSKNVVLMLNLRDITIECFGKAGKLNSLLNKIYSEIRNKYYHGKIDLLKEFIVIDSSDYFIMYQAYMSCIIMLFSDPGLNFIKTSDDLRGYLNSRNMV